MKRILFFATLLLLNFQAIAQMVEKGTITGIIIDSASNKAVDYATITLFEEGKTKSINGALADEKGKFSLKDVPYGNYRIVVYFLGYKQKEIKTIAIKSAMLNLGTIAIVPSTTNLSAVEIVADKPLIENKIDRLVYNAEKDVTAMGGNATDVLRKVPLLSVDIDGNVSLRGDQNVKILINGKPSGAMSNNVGDALKMIPADQISNVEVITSPSAKYDGEGTSGIINIITKKKTVAGMNGSLSAGIGTRQNSTNGNVNIRKGKLGVVANAGVNWMWPQITTNTFSQIDQNGNSLLRQNGENNTTRGGGRGSVGVDYDFNKKNLFTTTLTVNKFDMDFDGTSQSIFKNQAVLASNKVQNTGSNGLDWSASYTHKFDKEKQELILAGQFSRNESNTDYTTLYTNGDRMNEYGLNKGLNDELTFQVDYVQPLKKSATLEFGAKTILRDINSDVLLQEIKDGKYLFNQDRSYNFNYNQDVMAAYTSLNIQLSKNYQLMAGLRAEQTIINGESIGSLQAFKNDYLNMLPSAVISRKLGRMSSLKLSYNQRIQRPSLFYLNPFRNTSDPVNQSQGNPTLKPELAHNFELAYATFYKGMVLSTSVYYRLTNDVIESLFTNQTNPDGSGQPIVLQTFDNIGRNKSLGMNIFASISPIKPLTLRSNLSLFTYSIQANNVSDNLSTKTDQTFLMYRAFVNASYVIKAGFTAETFFILNAPKRTFQGTSPSFNMWSLGLKKEVFNKKASIGLNILDPFNETKTFKSEVFTPNYTQKSNFAVPFRSFGLSFNWNFGKMNFKDAPRKDRGIKNDDQKKEEAQQGTVTQ